MIQTTNRMPRLHSHEHTSHPPPWPVPPQPTTNILIRQHPLYVSGTHGAIARLGTDVGGVSANDGLRRVLASLDCSLWDGEGDEKRDRSEQVAA